MVELTVYPSSYENPDGWSNPSYADGVHDDLCAAKSLNASYHLRLKTFDLSALPDDAILDNVYAGHHGILVNAFSPTSRLSIDFKHGIQTVGGAELLPQSSGTCANAANAEFDVLPLFTGAFALTVTDLKTEDFEFWEKDTYGTVGSDVARVDCAWLRIVYHLPSTSKNMQIDGLVSILC